MFVTPAYAQQATPGGLLPGGFEALLPLLLIFVVFYFLLIRPQQKKVKQHKDMLGAIRRGDKIVTGGGIMGTVTKVTDEHTLTVEIAPDVKVQVQRGLVSAVVSKTEPVKGKGSAEQRKDEAGADKKDEPKAAEPAVVKESPLSAVRRIFLGGGR